MSAIWPSCCASLLGHAFPVRVGYDPSGDGGLKRSLAPDPDAEILLLGYSFTNIYSSEDNRWAASRAWPSNSPWRSIGPRPHRSQRWRGLHRPPTSRSVTPSPRRERFLIYEFAVRDLAGGDWKVVLLPCDSPKTEVPAAATITGVIREFPVRRSQALFLTSISTSASTATGSRILLRRKSWYFCTG